MRLRNLPLLLCATALLAGDPAPTIRTPIESSLSRAVPSTVKGGGARMTRAEVELMIQDREDRLMPSALRRDFRVRPEAVTGWVFRRRALLDLLYSMKDQSDDAPVFMVLGHTPNLDAAGKPIPGTWHETLILCETRPFYWPAGAAFLSQSATTDDSYYLQHPNPFP